MENSFYYQSWNGKRVLILAPHQDDEIHMAGNIAANAADAGAEAFLVYTTNGDWKMDAAVRFREAQSAARVLGIPSSHIFYMGYGDCLNNPEHTHLFYHWQDSARSPAGHEETYAPDGFHDYACLRRGRHSEYRFSAFLADMKSVIEDIHADVIICTDYDQHADHRALALAFDAVMGMILRERPEYRPYVLKRFAYCLSYTAVDDYQPYNNPETQRPQLGVTKQYAADIVDRSVYQWEKRIRLPIIRGDWKYERMRNAIARHSSQYLLSKAGSILNSDEVFWERRCDSLSYTATVTASSGNPEYLRDFCLYKADEIDAETPSLYGGVWRPDSDDERAEATFAWDAPQTIRLIRLYGSIMESEGVPSLTIEMDNGCGVDAGPLPPYGQPLDIAVGVQENVRRCRVRLIRPDGHGLSECEFYREVSPPTPICPFIKIMVGDNFAYEYFIPKHAHSLQLNLYRYRFNGSVSFSIVEGDAVTQDDTILFGLRASRVTVRAQADDAPEICDEITISRATAAALLPWRLTYAANRVRMGCAEFLRRCHVWRRYFRAEGGAAFARRVARKIVRRNR